MKIRTKNLIALKKHLFTNILFCADCGRGMWYRSRRKGYIYGSYARYGKKACSIHNIKKQNSINITRLVHLLNDHYFVKQLVIGINQSYRKSKVALSKVKELLLVC
ncbi:zinc ribbon domain-containing protein [Ectobacillus sp. JY-23]|uniref:zinc ribbon domain-containing protein n=1 Tax=Ectobacillus sp. JY-23 TaxID=2933872 RepID=UPI0034A032CB